MTTRRRGRGEGSVVRRADGRWMARLDLGWRDGRRRRKTVYGRTRRQVADKLAALLHRTRAEDVPTDERQTVRQFIRRWLADVAKPRVRPRTWETYEAAVTRHIDPFLGSKQIAKLAPHHVQDWLSTLEARGVSASRRRYARVVLRAVLNTALRWRLVAVNAAALVDPPRAIRREIRPLHPDEAKRLLKAAEGRHPIQAFVTVALSCGLRVGEALGLRWADIDLDAGSLAVTQAIQRSGGDPVARRVLLAEQSSLRADLRRASAKGASVSEIDRLRAAFRNIRGRLAVIKTSLNIVEPKSARSRRTIALPAVTVAALRRHRRQQLKARLAAGKNWRDTGLVFTTSIGTPIEPSNLAKAFKRLLTDADLPSIRLHDLRHTAATLLLTQGVSPRVVMETLGHSQISLTMNTYSHVLPELQREAAEKMNALLSAT